MTYLKKEADNIRLILEENEIDYKIISGKGNFETSMGVSSSQQYEVLVKSELLTKALDLINEFLENNNEEIDLSQFSDAEINDIILNPDDWHDSFVSEAKKIIKERNINIYQDIKENLHNNFSDFEEFPDYETYIEEMKDIQKYIDSNSEVIYFSKWKQLSKLLIVFGSIPGLYYIFTSTQLSSFVLLLIILLAILGLGFLLVDSIRKFKAITTPQIVLNDNGLACRGHGFVKWNWITDWEIKKTSTGKHISHDLYVYILQAGKDKIPRVMMNLDDLNIRPKKLQELIEDKMNHKK